MLLACFQITKAAVFVEEGELTKSAVERRVANEAGGGHEFYVDPYPLAGILHLFVRFGTYILTRKSPCQ